MKQYSSDQTSVRMQTRISSNLVSCQPETITIIQSRGPTITSLSKISGWWQRPTQRGSRRAERGCDDQRLLYLPQCSGELGRPKVYGSLQAYQVELWFSLTKTNKSYNTIICVNLSWTVAELVMFGRSWKVWPPQDLLFNRGFYWEGAAKKGKKGKKGKRQ